MVIRKYYSGFILTAHDVVEALVCRLPGMRCRCPESMFGYSPRIRQINQVKGLLASGLVSDGINNLFTFL